MPRDLSGLGNTRVPAASELTGKQGYLSDYNEAYIRLAEKLRIAINTIRTYDKNFGMGTEWGSGLTLLGTLEYRFRPNEQTQQPFALVVGEENRYYPAKPSSGPISVPIVNIPTAQLGKLIKDLESISGFSADGKYQLYGSYDGPEATIIHRVGVDPQGPLEQLLIEFQKKSGIIYKPVELKAPISPAAVEAPNYHGYKVNEALTAFDLTESGESIPLGYNRLALMDTILRYLVAEIHNKERRSVARADRIQTLGKI
ncbi:hypothetical protein HYX00_06190 [Candidatus Woesearchaeota archaeon]|nr:hypothetical protein [Candidatus Woesearchaeota archaeon]